MYCFKISNCDRSKVFGFQNCMSISHCDIFQCKIIIQYTLIFRVSYCILLRLVFLLFPSELWRYNIIYDFKTSWVHSHRPFSQLSKLFGTYSSKMGYNDINANGRCALLRHQWMQLLIQIYILLTNRYFCARNKNKLKAIKLKILGKWKALTLLYYVFNFTKK